MQRHRLDAAQCHVRTGERTRHRQIASRLRLHILQEPCTTAQRDVAPRVDTCTLTACKRSAHRHVAARPHGGVAGEQGRTSQRDVLRRVRRQCACAVQCTGRRDAAGRRRDREIPDGPDGTAAVDADAALRRERHLRGAGERTVHDNIARRLHVRTARDDRVAVERHVAAPRRTVRRHIEQAARLQIADRGVVARVNVQILVGSQCARGGDITTSCQRKRLRRLYRAADGNVAPGVQRRRRISDHAAGRRKILRRGKRHRRHGLRVVQRRRPARLRLHRVAAQ